MSSLVLIGQQDGNLSGAAGITHVRDTQARQSSHAHTQEYTQIVPRQLSKNFSQQNWQHEKPQVHGETVFPELRVTVIGFGALQIRQPLADGGNRTALARYRRHASSNTQFLRGQVYPTPAADAAHTQLSHTQP
jgi:hypothetical protein